jgi:hypothetical protein
MALAARASPEYGQEPGGAGGMDDFVLRVLADSNLT